jgi:hypothetical protein
VPLQAGGRRGASRPKSRWRVCRDEPLVSGTREPGLWAAYVAALGAVAASG